MDEMSKNMLFEYPEKPKFTEQETGHVYFDTGTDESTEQFSKNVKLEAHTEYTSHVNGKIGEGGDDSVLVSLIDRSITEIRNDSVTSVGVTAFYVCSALTAIDLPNATSVGATAFAGCSALTTVDLPNATSVGDGAFYVCSALTTVDLPNAMSIGDGAFRGCSALATVNLPNVTSIGENAFDGISSSAVINLGAAEGEITGAPWGAPNGVTINYNVLLRRDNL